MIFEIGGFPGLRTTSVANDKKGSAEPKNMVLPDAVFGDRVRVFGLSVIADIKFSKQQSPNIGHGRSKKC
jgi:hypothetical protein